ncbi:MAG: hypothetical protein QG608_1973 [Actinomycetota bacterium]|nr:hypothetical protein [Actinomycetota bacterium]
MTPQPHDHPVFDPTPALCLCGARTAPGVLCRKCRARLLWHRRQTHRARLFQQRARDQHRNRRETRRPRDNRPSR